VRLKTENSVYGGSINMNRLLKIKKVFFLYPILVICVAAARCGGSGKSGSRHSALTITITSTESSPVSTLPVPVTFTFNRDVTGFEQSDITVTNGTLGNFTSTSASVYTATITPSSDPETITVSVAKNAAVDSGNIGNDEASFNIFYGTVTLTISSTESNPTLTNPVPVTFTFNRGVTGFEQSDISVTNGTLSDFTAVSSTVYTASITPSTNPGLITVSVAAGAATDSNGIGCTEASFSIAYGSVTLAISSTEPNPASTDPIPVTFTFNHDVTGFEAGDITVTNGTLNSFTAVSGSVYTADITPDTDPATITVTVAAGVASDSCNIENPEASFSIVYGTVTLAITSTEASPTSASTIPVTFTFNRDVTGFESGDVNVTNGTLSSFTVVSGSVYTANITPAADGTITVTVPEGSASDSNNIENIATDFSIIYDSAAPASVTLTSATVTDTTITFTWTNPSDTDLDHISVCWSGNNTSGGPTAVAKALQTYTINSLTALTEYIVTITAVDSSGNTASFSVSLFTSSDATEKAYNLIYDADDLNNVRNDLTGYYIVMKDIDLSDSDYSTGEGWTPIGYWDNTADVGYYFSGIFNGNGHVIRNLYINDSSGNYKGLFGVTGIDEGGTGTVQIYNLGLESVSITGTYNVGAIAGYTCSAIIKNCYATGTVTENNCTGGLVGGNDFSSTITDCYATGAVTGSENYTGGLVGNNSYSTITDCYATGTVTGSNLTGGLVGGNTGYPITDCYATGAVTGSGYDTGGLLGFVNDCIITDCYATGAVSGSDSTGGFAGGTLSATITSCYYDSTTTGQSDTGKGTPYTTTQIKLQDLNVVIYTNIYVGWDFVNETANGTDNVWSIDTTGTINGGYPYLTNLVP